jgi:hypothetical protein
MQNSVNKTKATNPSPELIGTAPRPNVLVGLLLGCLAILVGWGFIHTKHPVFTVPKEYHITAMGESLEVAQRLIDKRREIDRQNAMLVLAVFGGVLGAALMIGKSPMPLPVRVMSGLVGGALIGALAGFVGSAAHDAFTPVGEPPTIADTIKIQVAMFATLGAGIGVFKGGLEKRITAPFLGLVTGSIAGLVAGTAYPIVASLMPTASTVPLIPDETGTRLVWLAAPAIACSLIIPIGLQQKKIVPADEISEKPVPNAV